MHMQLVYALNHNVHFHPYLVRVGKLLNLSLMHQPATAKVLVGHKILTLHLHISYSLISDKYIHDLLATQMEHPV